MLSRFTLDRACRWAAVVLVGCVIVGCGDGLSGHKYTEKESKDGIEFKSGNKAYVTLMGMTREVKYRVDGDKIILDAGGSDGTLVVTRQKDGTITGLPMTGPLLRE